MSQYIFVWILQLVAVPMLAPLGVGLIDTLKARFQRKQGPGVLQTYRNLWKLFHKDEVVSKDVSFIFRWAPYILFATTLIVGASIPIFTIVLSSPMSDLLVVIYILTLGVFFMALAGMDSGSAFGGFGSSREMTLSALTEAALIFSILSVAFISGTTNITDIAAGVSMDGNIFLIPVILASVGFMIALLAETSRYPFDNPATHLELTMIHEAMLLEYSGKRLALMEWAAANRLLIFSLLLVNLFFPFGIAHAVTFGSIVLGIGAVLVKLMVVYVIVAFIESLIAKYRFFRLPDILLVSFVLNVVAIGLTL